MNNAQILEQECSQRHYWPQLETMQMSVDRRLDQEIVHTRTIKYDSVIKKNEVLVPATTPTHLENMMPNERSQTQKVPQCMTAFP